MRFKNSVVYSLTSDSFPENKQGKPMGIITSGVYIGIGITLLGGGFLIDYLTQIGGINLPLIGYLKPWQATFMIVGIPGLILALAAFLLKEPKRIDEQVNLDKAIDSYKLAIMINPQSSECHFNLGTAYNDKREYENALNHFKSAFNYDSDNIETLLNIGALHEKLGHWKDSL